MINAREQAVAEKLKSIGICIAVVIAVYSNFLESFTHIKFFTYTDELIMLFFFYLVAVRLILYRTIPFLALFMLGTIIVFIVITYISKYTPSTYRVVLGAIIHLKWFLFFIAIYYLYRNRWEYLLSTLKAVLIISAVGLTLNIILGNTFYDIINLSNNNLRVSGRLAGFEMNPNNIVTCYSLLYMYLLFKDGLPSYKKLGFYTILFIIFSIVITGSRSPLLIVPIAGLYFVANNKSKAVASILLIGITALAVPVFLLIGGDVVERTKRTYMEASKADESNYARGLLLVYSFKIASDYFPLGTGVSTYGSVLAIDSPVYKDLGMNRYMLFESHAGNDTNFAVILGETGVLGLSMILFLVWRTRKFIIHRLVFIDRNKHFINMALLSVLIFFVVRPLLVAGYHCIMYAIFINLHLLKNHKNLLQSYGFSALRKEA